jgi:molybdate transport system substrate-binding protein
VGTDAEALTGISSMATRQVLAELGDACERAGGSSVRFESVGGVNAARRIRAGESFDLVVLAADAVDALAAEGRVIASSRRPLLESTVAIAARAGAAQPHVGSEAALRRAVLAAERIGYSTGPSGTALLQLFARWGVTENLRDRLVQARPGLPVAALLASGEAELGFQQLSELRDQEGIVVLGGMPPGLEIVTTFVGAVGAASTREDSARATLRFMSSPAVTELKRCHGMAEARADSLDSQAARDLP